MFALKDHPFGVEAFFKTSLVLTYAVPKEQLEDLIPECLELDMHEDKWAFIAVALVQTTALRPKGFPAFIGNDFYLVGYRIFVRYHTNAGKRLRGLYILRSETDKKKMELLGSLFTRYKYTTTDITQTVTGSETEIRSAGSGFRLLIERPEGEISLPAGSPFSDWKTARRFAGPLPFTFSYDPEKNQVLIIEGVRESWKPQPVKVKDHRFSFVESLGLKGLLLANAFIIENIPYQWKKGRTEQWQG
jgi:uncharacterized protein YqjF (DUF2071 family)